MELIFLTGIIILCFLASVFLQWKSLHRPPCIRGWIPWIGAAFKLGKTPLDFLEKARSKGTAIIDFQDFLLALQSGIIPGGFFLDKYGPIFTVFAMGNRMTFVIEEAKGEGFHLFAKSTDLSFTEALQKTMSRTVLLPRNIYLEYFEKNKNIIRGILWTSNTSKFTGQLTEAFKEQLEKLGTYGTMNLYEFVSHLLCPVIVNVLLKKGLFPMDERKIREFYEHLQTFDDNIHKASNLPEFLLRNWSKSRNWLLKHFEENIPLIKTYKSSKDDSMTLYQSIFDVIQMGSNEIHCHKYGLLLLWASTTNTIPIAFWTLGLILFNPKIHKAIKDDVSSVFGTAGKDKIEVSEDDLKRLPLIRQCIMETLRLKGSNLIVRRVLKPLKISNYIVPAGDLLLLTSYWLHRNPNIFPEPELFKPERWENTMLEKHAFMAFGVGKHECPGRLFALLEIQTFITLIIYNYDCRLLDPLPKASYVSLIGTQKPEGPCRIEFKQRK